MDPKSVESFVKEGKLVWTMTTNGYKTYTLNLIASLKEVAKVPWTLCVICCDTESLGFFRREGIRCIGYKASETRGQQNLAVFGTGDFAKWNKKKVELLKWFSEHAGQLGIRRSLYLDGDIVVQRDPWPVLEGVWQGGAPSLLFQCDCVSEETHSNCGVICSGVIAENHSEAKGELYDHEQEGWMKAERQDQPYIAARLKALGIPYGTLERRLWGNGHWQKGLKWQGDSEWVLLHYNYRMGDTKKQAMKKYGHWRIPY